MKAIIDASNVGSVNDGNTTHYEGELSYTIDGDQFDIQVTGTDRGDFFFEAALVAMQEAVGDLSDSQLDQIFELTSDLMDAGKVVEFVWDGKEWDGKELSDNPDMRQDLEDEDEDEDEDEESDDNDQLL
jgi:hypothetical protein